MKSRAAFTLIELLAVIAIILILLTLMFPSVFLINARASRFACFNNIKNLQAGVLFYAADVGGGFPSSMTSGQTNCWATTGDYKQGVVWPYINSPDRKTLRDVIFNPAITQKLLSKPQKQKYINV